MGISYVRSISVPNMNMLNPAVVWKNEYSYTTGNPYLKPALKDEYMVTTTLFNRLSLVFTHAITPVFKLFSYKETDKDIIYQSYDNGGEDKFYVASIGYTAMVKNLMLNTSVSCNYVKEQYISQQITATVWNVNVLASYRLPQNYSMSGSLFYTSPAKNVFGQMGAVLNCDLSIRKTLLRNQLNISCSYNYSPSVKVDYKFSDVIRHTVSNDTPHSVRLNISYNVIWGNRSARIRKNNHTGANETGRMK